EKMLQESKRQCDYLLVGMETDPTIDSPEINLPTQAVVERFTQLMVCKFVGEIVLFDADQDMVDILRSFKIDVRIIGEEYRDKDFTGRAYCEEKGIELYFNKRDHRFSSSGLRKVVAEKEINKKV